VTTRNAAVIGAILGALLIQAPVKAQPRLRGEAWSCSVDDVGSTLTLCEDALEPGIGHRYITDVIAQSTGQASVTFGLWAGTGVNCEGGTVSLAPEAAVVNRLATTAILLPTVLSLQTPLQIPRGMNFCVSGGKQTNVTVQIQGTIGA